MTVKVYSYIPGRGIGEYCLKYRVAFDFIRNDHSGLGTQKFMIYKEEIAAALDAALLREGMEDLRMPPPVFEAMQGVFISFDRQQRILKAGFPVLPEQLNPYGTMQGGMVGAAIDNTLGPLSILVAPPNYTRRLQIKYRRVITPEIGWITVIGRFIEQRKRQLFFSAGVIDNAGNELASAKAVHWIVDSE